MRSQMALETSTREMLLIETSLNWNTRDPPCGLPVLAISMPSAERTAMLEGKPRTATGARLEGGIVDEAVADLLRLRQAKLGGADAGNAKRRQQVLDFLELAGVVGGDDNLAAELARHIAGAPLRGDGLLLRRRQFRKAINPAGRDSMRGAGIEDLRLPAAQARGVASHVGDMRGLIRMDGVTGKRATHPPPATRTHPTGGPADDRREEAFRQDLWLSDERL